MNLELKSNSANSFLPVKGERQDRGLSGESAGIGGVPTDPLLRFKLAGIKFLNVNDLLTLTQRKNRANMVRIMREQIGAYKLGKSWVSEITMIEKWFQNHFDPSIEQRVAQMLTPRKHKKLGKARANY